MNPDTQLDIATAPKTNSFHWTQEWITWGEVLAWARTPAKHKHCGGYVFGELRATTTRHDREECTALHRNRDAVVSRCVLTLDIDKDPDPGLVDKLDLVFGWEALVHTTFSSKPGALRLRVLLPLSRPVSAQEYRALAGWVMGQLGGHERFDPGSAEPERFMFKPAARHARWFEHWHVDGDPINVDAALSDAPNPVTNEAPDTAAPAETWSPPTPRELEKATSVLTKLARDMAETPEGERNKTLLQCLAILYRFVLGGFLDEDEVEERMREAADLAGIGDEYDACRDSAWRYAADDGPQRPKVDSVDEVFADPEDWPDVPTRLDDAHLAAWLGKRGLGGEWCWAGGLGWRHWDGKRWTERRDEDAREAVRLAVIEVNKRALDRGADSATMKELNKLLSTGRIGSLTSLMKGVVAVDGGAFDQQPDLLNVGNGVVNLSTGELGPHDPSLYLTRLTETPYEPDAVHADWTKALNALDPEVAEWMQVRFGQAATGYPTSDDVLPVGQGGGSNGKSTILTALFGALGEHITQVPEKLLRASPNDHPTELMTLFGARVAVIDETPEVGQLNVQRLKSILGQDWVTARAIRRDNVTWRATHSLFVMTNYTPSVRETDHGTWRRLALVRFTKTFPKDDRFRARMARGDGGRREAVLAWVVAGARRWYADERLMPPAPARVGADTREWREECDVVLAYLAERLVFDPDAAVLSRELLEDFNDWLHWRNHKAWSDKLFAARFGQHDVVTRRGVTKGNPRAAPGLVRRLSGSGDDGRDEGARPRVWLGVRWRTADDAPESAD